MKKEIITVVTEKYSNKYMVRCNPKTGRCEWSDTIDLAKVFSTPKAAIEFLTHRNIAHKAEIDTVVVYRHYNIDQFHGEYSAEYMYTTDPDHARTLEEAKHYAIANLQRQIKEINKLNF